MNFSSILVLAVLAVLFVAALRYTIRSSRRGSCAGCSEKCDAAATGGAASCTTMRRALDEVEARLGERGSTGDAFRQGTPAALEQTKEQA